MRKTFITNLKLRGFKSFNKHTNIELGPGFNCIAGANGSGKSNVMDALCFVLGRLSTKSIRADNYGELIHKKKDKQQANGGAKFGLMINEFLNVEPEMIAEHGADAKYVVAGAASILAKVTRDREVARIVEEIGAEIGSGYPHDPVCRAYLKENFRGPIHKYLRKCWSTYKALNEAESQMNLSEF